MKKVASILFACVLMLTMLPVLSLTASAAGPADGMYYSVSNGNVTITDYTGSTSITTTALFIPAKIETYPVTAISAAAFDGSYSSNNDRSSYLKSLTIPATVETIAAGAFRGCTNLTSFAVASTNPAYCAVDGVLFTKDMTTLLAYPAGKTGEYVIPSTVTTIADYAFYKSYASSVTIPDSVTGIGKYAFAYNDRLTSIEIPDSVTTLGTSAFYFSDGALTSVTIGSGLVTIPSSAFYSCSKLATVTLTNKTTTINGDAFVYCSALKNVYYGGTAGEWADTVIMTGNTLLTSATMHFDPLPSVVYTIGTKETRKIVAGQTFSLDVTVGNIEKICMVEFKFAYDATKVKAVSSETKGFLADFAMKNINLAPTLTDNTDETVGEVWITGMALADSTAKKGDVIATITFEALCDIEEDLSIYCHKTPMAAYAPSEELVAGAVNGGVKMIEGILGDFDDNGEINMMDALLVYSQFTAGVFPEEKIVWVDMDATGEINMMDCLLLFNMASGMAI